MKAKILLCSSLLIVSASTWAGDESRIQLKNAPGREKVLARCVICHSADYIPMNSVFMDRKAWAAEVDKMIHVMGAPVAPEEVPVIVDYLTKNYGRPN